MIPRRAAGSGLPAWCRQVRSDASMVAAATAWLGRHRRDGPLPARPAVVAAACLAAGCGLGRLAVGGTAWPCVACWAAAGVLLVLWGAAAAAGRPRAAAAAICLAITACGAAWAAVRLDLFRGDDLAWQLRETPSPVAVRGVVERAFALLPSTGDPRREAAIGPSYESVVRIEASRVGSRWRPASGRATLVVHGGPPAVGIGDRVLVFGRGLRPAAALNPGEFDRRERARSARRLSVIRVASPAGVRPIGPSGSAGVFRWIDGLRSQGVAVLHRHVSPARAPLAAALLLGSRESLPRDDADDFLATGTVHVLSISGLHVGLLAMALFRGLRLAAASRGWAASAVAVVTGLYMLLVRAETPVVRATLLVWLSCLAAALGRRSPAVNGLAVSAIVVLALRPGDVLDPGPQLSFLSTAVLVGVAAVLDTRRRTDDPIERLIDRSRPRPERILRAAAWHVAAAFAAGAAVWIATAPLVALRFHVVSPVALLVNLVVAPLTALAMAAGFLCLLAAPLATPLAGWFGGGCDAMLACLTAVVRRAAEVPGGHAWVAGPPSWWVVGWYATLGGAVVWCRRETLGRPVPWAVLAGGWLAVLAAAEGSAGLLGRPVGLRGVVAAMGHGCGVVLTTPTGRTLVFDAGRLGAAGAAGRSMASVLWSAGTRRIDHLVVSHADADHFNAVPALLERFAVGEVLVPEHVLSGTSAGVRQLLAAVRQKHVPLRPARAGDTFAIDRRCRVRVLHPPAGPPPSAGTASDNESSLVMAVESAGRRWLFTGDIEGAALERFVASRPDACDVLVAPHHGSVTSLPPDVAAATRPAVVLVSGAEGRSWPLVHEAYRRASGGAAVLRTGRAGAIAVEADAGAIVVSRFSRGRWRPVR